MNESILGSIGVQKAISLLRKASTPEGIVASIIDSDNYHRIWARDAMISGLAGLLIEDEYIIEGMHRSLLTLAKNRSNDGFIPSNVEPSTGHVSYGSLAGRLDADAWFLIGAGLYYLHSKDQIFFDEIVGVAMDVFDLMNKWEFNGRKLMYTPLSGNWADEYPLHGYLLYDNALRIWAYRIWSNLLESPLLKEKENAIIQMVQTNFWPMRGQEKKEIYHPRLHKMLSEQTLSHYIAGFNPGRVYTMFDASANGLALLLGFYNEDQQASLVSYCKNIFNTLSHDLIPAFWPVIDQKDDLWPDIENNYSYEFKNWPHHFHNGGIWPVMMGIFSLGMTSKGQIKMVEKINKTYSKFAEAENWIFSEYISSDKFIPSGKTSLCFSAAGTIFMHAFDPLYLEKKLATST